MARPRSWTDTDLRSAIAAATSWRDTARALGLGATSTKSLRAIRRRAAALGLDHATSADPMGAPGHRCRWW